MTTQTCDTGCGRPATTGLCRDCTRTLRTTLNGIAGHGTTIGLADELDTAISRQTALTDTRIGIRTPTTDRPLPYDHTAAAVATDLTDTLTAWASDLITLNPNDTPPPERPRAIARWLAHRADRLATHPHAGQLHDEITHAARRGWQAVDRAAALVYLGRCAADTTHGPCPADLYTKPTAATATCPDCRTQWDTTERRHWLLSLVDDQLATATEISRALPTLINAPITAAMIRNYADRGRIARRPPDAHGRPRYRIGDVLDALTRHAENPSLPMTRADANLRQG